MEKKETKQLSPKELMLELKHNPPNDTKELLAKNLLLSELIFEQNQRLQHRLTLMVIGNYVRLTIILTPIILGIIYLPPLVKDVWKDYGHLLGGAGVFLENVGELSNFLESAGLDAGPF